MSNRAKLGDRVRVNLAKLSLATGKPAHPKVLEFTVGSKKVMSGVNAGVVGMARGEKKQLMLDPKDAYGAVRRDLFEEVPRGRFPATLKLIVGKRLTAVGVTSGRRRKVKVVEIKPASVVIDGNHPLAGKVLKVELKLLSLGSEPGEA